MTSYDELPYDSLPCPQSHPDNLAAVARLFGLAPAKVTSCRVLELGCGTGANLVPMAPALPGSQLLGVDLSAVQISMGQRDVDALGLSNVRLLAGDLAALPQDLGTFDFVIAHGVYSWVPRPIQEALLEVIGGCLAEEGVAYVSYSALPGSHSRQALRDMLCWRVRGEPSARRRVELARGLCELLAGHLSDRAPNASALRRLLAEAAGMSDAYFLHDLLCEGHEALTLTDFVERAARHGLAYLGDAQLHPMFPGDLEAEALTAITEMVTGQVGFEQVLDFAHQRPFRTTLLHQAGRAIDRRLDWRRLEGLFLTTRAHPRGREKGDWIFRAPEGDPFGTSSPLVAAALTHLCRERPRPVPFRELCDRARAEVDGQPATSDDVALLGTNLLAAAASDQVSLGTWDRGIRSASLVAFAYARLQASRGATATNLWHQSVQLTPEQRLLVPLLDGTRSREVLLEAIKAQRPDADDLWLEAQLGGLAAAALLAA